MSVARINMVEWRSEEEFLEISEEYNKVSKKLSQMLKYFYALELLPRQ